MQGSALKILSLNFDMRDYKLDEEADVLRLCPIKCVKTVLYSIYIYRSLLSKYEKFKLKNVQIKILQLSLHCNSVFQTGEYQLSKRTIYPRTTNCLRE